MRATRPLFRFDPGWLFIVAGLAVCAAGVLLPAQADLRSLEEQLDVLHDEEARAYQRLAAHADFIDQVDRSEPAIIKRLAAAQLNLVPEGDKPVVLAASNTAPVTSWIDSTLLTDIRPPEFEPVSTLSRWANGPSRLWMFGGGIMAVFIGLLISPEGSKQRGRSNSARIQPTHHFLSTAGGTRVAEAEQESDDDVAFIRAQQLVMHFANPEPSLPETVDLEDRRDLSQQEDTVDLEENELPALSRTVIDDDAAWHDAAKIEHASEVIIEARVVASPEDQHSLWKEEAETDDPAQAAMESESLTEPMDGSPGAVSVSASAYTGVEDDKGAEDLDDLATEANRLEDDVDARLAATIMLLPESGEATVSAIDQAIEAVKALKAVANVAPEPVAASPKNSTNDANTLREDSDSDFGTEPPPVVEVEAMKADLGGKNEPHVEPATASKRAVKDGVKLAAKAPPKKQAKPGKTAERKPGPRKSTRSSGDSSAIPFLRYRPSDDDESAAEEEDADDVGAIDDSDVGMITMEAGDDVADDERDDADEDGPLQIR